MPGLFVVVILRRLSLQIPQALPVCKVVYEENNSTLTRIGPGTLVNLNKGL